MLGKREARPTTAFGAALIPTGWSKELREGEVLAQAHLCGKRLEGGVQCSLSGTFCIGDYRPYLDFQGQSWVLLLQLN